MLAECRERPALESACTWWIGSATPMGGLRAAIVGFVLAGTAVYTALATSLEDIHGVGILPIGWRGRAAQAIRGGMADQLVGLEREAGVRQQM